MNAATVDYLSYLTTLGLMYLEAKKLLLLDLHEGSEFHRVE